MVRVRKRRRDPARTAQGVAWTARGAGAVATGNPTRVENGMAAPGAAKAGAWRKAMVTVGVGQGAVTTATDAKPTVEGGGPR